MLEIRHLDTSGVLYDYADALGNFFEELAGTDYVKYYHPFPLTREAARKLCGTPTLDHHYILVDVSKPTDEIVGHGMLRGWNEGYDIPSLGIVIHPNLSGLGVGKMFVQFLHIMAWLQGCQYVRLTVPKQHVGAVKLYERLGYKWNETIQTDHGEKLCGYVERPRYK